MIEKLLIFAGGVVIGATAAYFCTKLRCEKIIEDEVNAIREHCQAKSNNKKKKETEPKSKNDDDISKDEVELKVWNAVSDDPEATKALIDYGASFPYDIPEDKLVRSEAPEQHDSVCYEIDDSDFISNMKDYNQITLTYYVDDDLIIDEAANEVFDEECWLDHDILNRFLASDAIVLYMRNDEVATDFEIVKERGHWEA